MNQKKIAIIGAGSIVFCSTLLNDIFGTPALDGFEIALMGPTLSKVERMKNYADKIIKENGLKSAVYATTDRRNALKDASYVILLFQIGGSEAFGIDYEIPMKYGVDQCIGDSMGPGGVFRLLRSVPVMQEIDRDMQELCPDAYVLNYVNPMGAVCTFLGRYTQMKFIGLCHGVQTTMDLIAGYTGVPKDEIDFTAAGINHMAWFLELQHNGKDLYPILHENMEKPEYFINEKVRGEVMRQCGYFMTESTGHLSEYLPWFRKNKAALDEYCDMPDFGGATGAYYHYSKGVMEKYATTDVFALESGKLDPRSKEYCSYILEAIETGVPFKLNGNVINRGYIQNLPDNACVEVPVFVDKMGLHPTVVGQLPTHLAAMNQSNLTVQALAAEGAFLADPEMVYWAIAMDPLTSAVLTLREIRDMVADMFEAQAKWLPDFAGKQLKRTAGIAIPAGIVPAEVPVDPALAISGRFGKL
ncbi:MAG: alpha-galactosidase [Defluviitaleaceae bacterium]|nr:alpha-galactosidase [Defluviitaleaceae bacterium]